MIFWYPGKTSGCQQLLAHGESMRGHLDCFAILVQETYSNIILYFSFTPSSHSLLFFHTQQGFRIFLTRLAGHLSLHNII